MSVYTNVEPHQLENFLSYYNVGNLISYEGISAGIENTNYFVTTSTGKFVLTLFEYFTDEELPYFLDLMAYLAENEIPSAHPLADKKGQYLQHLNGKPAALVQRLPGKDIQQPNLIQCHAIGCSLGRLHVITTKNTSLYRANERGTHWWRVTANRVLPVMNQDDAIFLKAELDFQAQYQNMNLPNGIIHADLFRDNALFEDNELSGIIDFYYACNDAFVYDLAITVNDWCRLENGQLEIARVQAILDGYYQNRILNPIEKQAWFVVLRSAALRFWLSRLQDLHFPREGEITHIKDPTVFRNILQNHIENKDQYLALLEEYK